MALVVPDSLQKMNNIHRDILLRHFGQNYYAKQVLDTNVQFLFLCFTNRCGSNHFAELLSSTGIFNPAQEIYNAGTIVSNCKDRGLKSPMEFVNHAINIFKYNNCFVSKIAVEQLAILTEIGVLDQIIDRSHFIVIERNDKLSQAVSLMLAQQTGKWTSEQQSEAHDDDLRYDRAELTRIITYLVTQQMRFDSFFAENGLVPSLVTYEALVQEPQHYIDKVATLLGIGPLKLNPQALKLQRQANRQNQEWRQRYLDERETQPMYRPGGERS